MGLAQSLQMMLHGASTDEVLKNSFAGYAFEHFEIAAYTALGVMAHAAGEERIAQITQRILQEEVEMADWLEDHLPDTVERYLMLAATGEQKR